jgi:hypothetical protein
VGIILAIFGSGEHAPNWIPGLTPTGPTEDKFGGHKTIPYEVAGQQQRENISLQKNTSLESAWRQ